MLTLLTLNYEDAAHFDQWRVVLDGIVVAARAVPCGGGALRRSHRLTRWEDDC